jgi:hypothetical protein
MKYDEKIKQIQRDQQMIEDSDQEAPEKLSKTPSKKKVESQGETLKSSNKSAQKVTVVGNPNMWQLLEADVITGGFVSQTKAMYIHSVGCAIRTSVYNESGVTESMIFVPNTKIVNDVNNGKKVIKF